MASSTTTTTSIPANYIDTHVHLDKICNRHKNVDVGDPNAWLDLRERIRWLGTSECKTSEIELTKMSKKSRQRARKQAAERKRVAELGGDWVRFGGAVHICCDAASEAIEWSRAIVKSDERLRGSFGLHPHGSKHWGDDYRQRVVEAIRTTPRVVAYGEFGLDYYYEFSERDVQRHAFAEQCKLAVGELKLPLMIHTRDAEQDTLALLKEHVPRDWPMHMHCFTSSVDFAKQLLEHFDNVYFGVTGIVSFSNAEGVLELVRTVPLDRLLLETDGPFLAPVPFRGDVADPSHIPFIAERIARERNMTMLGLLKAARVNTFRLYKF
jgi:TatD DNase family protein